MFRSKVSQISGSAKRLAYIFTITGLALLALVILTFPASAADTPSKGAAGGSTNVQPQATCPADGQCFADVTIASSFYTFTNTLYRQDLVTGYACGGAGEPCDSENRPYYRPGAQVTRQQMAKFIDNARTLPGISVVSSNGIIPIVASGGTTSAIVAYSGASTTILATADSGLGMDGRSDTGDGVWGLSNSGIGVYGESSSGIGVKGHSNDNSGVYGYGTTLNGVLGESQDGYGVRGGSNNGSGVYGLSTYTYGVVGETYSTSASSAGVLGTSTDARGVYGSSTHSAGIYGDTSDGYAGYFQGNVYIAGTCTGCLGPSKVDDPLDPANKYLYQSPVQSDQMTDIYNGNVNLDANGEATVQMPDYFQALNEDFRYQLTPIGAPGPNLYIAEEVQDNHFKIAGGKAGMKVSWTVTGTRNDGYAKSMSTPAEQEKPADEKGTYVRPADWGQPESSGLGYDERQQMRQEAAAQAKP